MCSLVHVDTCKNIQLIVQHVCVHKCIIVILTSFSWHQVHEWVTVKVRSHRLRWGERNNKKMMLFYLVIFTLTSQVDTFWVGLNFAALMASLYLVRYSSSASVGKEYHRQVLCKHSLSCDHTAIVCAITVNTHIRGMHLVTWTQTIWCADILLLVSVHTTHQRIDTRT